MIKSITEFGMKLIIHSQTTTVDVWEWISNFIPHFIGHMVIWLLIHAEIKANPH